MQSIKTRESGIELLKIVSLFLIVCSHMAQTLSEPHEFVWYPEYVLSVDYATTDLQVWIIYLFRHFGSLGNYIFFIASFWFLCEKETPVKLDKIVAFIVDVWIISVAFWGLLVSLDIKIPIVYTIKSFFPTLFANNWFITCYILLYAIHPIYNQVIKNLTQKQLLVFCLCGGGLYFGIGTIKAKMLFASPLVIYSILYFMVAYAKNYMGSFNSNLRLNVSIGLTSFICLLVMLIGIELLGLKSNYFYDKIMFFAKNQSIFIVLIAFSLFNIFRHYQWRSKVVNIIASTSLVVYITHENLLFKELLRPYVFTYIHDTYGYSHIVFWVLFSAFCLFICSVILSLLYKCSVQKLTKLFSSYVCSLLVRV